MNARPNVSGWQHAENMKLKNALIAQGFTFECTSQGYRVSRNGQFIAAAGTLNKPHGRYAEANLRDNVQAALSIARNHAK